jgi:hypothetical protein
MHKWAFLVLSAFLLAGGCGGSRVSATKKTWDSSVLPVGDQIITSDEIIKHKLLGSSLAERLRPVAQESDFERFKKQVEPEVEAVLESKIRDILRYRQVKREVGKDIEEVLERETGKEVARLVVSKGSYARAEEYLKREGMDWDSFRELRKKQILIAWQLPEFGPITHSDLLEHYNQMKDESFAVGGTIQFRLIDIDLAVLRVPDPNQGRLEYAGELADDLFRRIQAGEDFGLLAEKYAGVSFVRQSEPVKPQSVTEPYDILAVEANNMEPGDIAQPIVNKEKDHIFVMKLDKKQPKGFKPLKQVQKEVEQAVIFDRKRKAIEDLDAKLARQMALIQKGEFIDFCLKKIHKMSNR